jgi:oligosaccharide reducing-end xylanase
MIHFSKKLFITLILVLSCKSFSQNGNSPYEIGTWQGFRTAAVCFTFDDNCPNQLALALPMFDKYNFKMTFYTVIAWSPKWEELQKAADNGHEIASHTCTHPNLGTLTEVQQDSQLVNSLNDINAQIKGHKCLTIAYPYCVTGDKSLSSKYYIAGRGCSGQIEPATPADFMNISSFVCGTMGSIKTAQDFASEADTAAAVKGLLVYLIHGIDNDGGYSPVTHENLNGALEYIKLNKAKFWESTFANIALYIKERDNSSIKELSSGDNSIKCNLTGTLDNSIYNYPITIRRQLPDNWASVSVSQSGKVLSSEIVQAGVSKYIMFDAVPNGGEILVSKQ